MPRATPAASASNRCGGRADAKPPRRRRVASPGARAFLRTTRTARSGSRHFPREQTQGTTTRVVVRTTHIARVPDRAKHAVRLFRPPPRPPFRGAAKQKTAAATPMAVARAAGGFSYPEDTTAERYRRVVVSHRAEHAVGGDGDGARAGLARGARRRTEPVVRRVEVAAAPAAPRSSASVKSDASGVSGVSGVSRARSMEALKRARAPPPSGAARRSRRPGAAPLFLRRRLRSRRRRRLRPRVRPGAGRRRTTLRSRRCARRSRRRARSTQARARGSRGGLGRGAGRRDREAAGRERGDCETRPAGAVTLR